MDLEALNQKVLYLREVEKLSIRQIARELRISRKRIRRILGGCPAVAVCPKKPSILEPYRHLIAAWYGEYPHLKAMQVYERLLAYGYRGSYRRVVEWTREKRQKKAVAYHTLEFLPGEEAQVDWFFFNHPRLGKLAGFLYVLAYSRYAWGKFYPRTSFEFFLAGHLECFGHLKGLARRHRYDNLKSVVLGRKENRIEYNSQFLDFARFFGFSIHVCNPYSGHEKGRVERVVRDARTFLYGRDFSDLKDLNLQFLDWLIRRSRQIHRVTGKTPLVLLSEEKLLGLPQGPYLPTRTVPAASVSKTAFVEFDANHYSVPSSCAQKRAEIIAWPEKIEIYVAGQRVAVHPRCFGRKEWIRNPLHAQSLLDRTGPFKYQRILQLMQSMAPEFREFLAAQQDETEEIQAAYELFGLLKTYSRPILTSAIRELAGMGALKMKALRSLLHLPSLKEGDPIWPVDTKLLNVTYPPRNLKDYDPAD